MPELLVSRVIIKIDGSPISPAMYNSLVLVDVDCSLHMPGTFRLEFTEGRYGSGDDSSPFEWVDNATLGIGREVEIQAAENPAVAQMNGGSNPATILKGSITALDPVFDERGLVRMVARGVDALYKLQRGTKTRTFQTMTDSQIIQKIIGEAGLQAQITSTSAQRDYVIQDDVSDYEFIVQLARRNGLTVLADGRSIKVKAPDAYNLGQETLTWQDNLLEFRPTLSIGGQVDTVQVHGWDFKQKQEVAGSATSPDFSPVEMGLGKRGPALAQSAAGAAKVHVAGTVPSQADAEKLALTTLNRLSAADIVGEGRCQGNPKIAAGGKVELRGLGSRFSGTYLVTRVRHYLTPRDSLQTEFWVGGMTSGTVAQMVAPPETPVMQRSASLSGLVPGIVTNNNDPEASGRVKVKFPTLSADEESAWARVVAPGAGADRGFMALPEVNDEVVVAFANGDPNYPYVLGGVWNGRDKLPTAHGTTIQNGKVEVREWKTRAGHTVRLTDASGEEKIEIIDKTNSNKIIIESSSNKITVQSGGDVHIEGSKNITVKAGSKLDMEAMQVNVKASAKLSLKAPMVDIAGDAKVSVTAPIVMIN